MGRKDVTHSTLIYTNAPYGFSGRWSKIFRNVLCWSDSSHCLACAGRYSKSLLVQGTEFGPYLRSRQCKVSSSIPSFEKSEHYKYLRVVCVYHFIFSLAVLGIKSVISDFLNGCLKINLKFPNYIPGPGLYQQWQTYNKP